MSQTSTISHPLIDHSLTILRDKNTKTAEFKHHASIISKLILIESLKSLKTKSKTITTPLAKTKGSELVQDVIVIPILRAGLAMLAAIDDFLPFVSVGFIGLERNEKTAIAREYYQKLPRILRTHQVIILDPMLATGGSFDDTIKILKKKKAANISIACIIASLDGVKRIEKKHKDVNITTAVIDKKLNSKKYIVPGLGDFGDRYFGTV
ncbi:uracil phosphoribosyltransferase [Patescibacteria group bacterium]